MSFQKRNADQQPKLPPGSRLSAYNGQLLISTGVPSLDDILGGGLPVGTVLLVKEDRATTYAQLLLKYFMAQGISSGHHCTLVSKDEDPSEMARNLMWLASSDADMDDDDLGNKTSNTGESDRMKIAWRYSHLKKFETSVKATPVPTPRPVTKDTVSTPTTSADKSKDPPPYCSLFDLTKRIPETILEQASLSLIDPSSENNDDDTVDQYGDLIQKIRKVILDGNFSSAIPVPPGTQRNALRIAIHSLASPSWQSKSSHDLFKFFHALRGLLRFSFGAAIVTIPAYLYEEVPNYICRVEHAVDAVIEIESFAGSSLHNDKPYTQNYHGFFHVHKLPVLNSLLPPSTKLSVLSAGGSNDLAFKLRRKRFAIETFHLPPEGGVVTRRTEAPETTEKPAKNKGSVQKRQIGGGCGSRPGKVDPLEF
ncbi:Elongator complex protein 4 [Halteromyces radiatus]|uniref:Elongator complex protein 4 n=1 Tax=Halteromyces radiatus TaxID=101107 RepID=UPI00222007EC|nr:Elongator complex protein 4 [Halteromyces radiatus]KAI8099970.1 Elongator complex protein 4 [Halteromyces radiatus]